MAAVTTVGMRGRVVPVAVAVYLMSGGGVTPCGRCATHCLSRYKYTSNTEAQFSAGHLPPYPPLHRPGLVTDRGQGNMCASFSAKGSWAGTKSAHPYILSSHSPVSLLICSVWWKFSSPPWPPVDPSHPLSLTEMCFLWEAHQDTPPPFIHIKITPAFLPCGLWHVPLVSTPSTCPSSRLCVWMLLEHIQGKLYLLLVRQRQDFLLRKSGLASVSLQKNQKPVQGQTLSVGEMSVQTP